MIVHPGKTDATLSNQAIVVGKLFCGQVLLFFGFFYLFFTLATRVCFVSVLRFYMATNQFWMSFSLIRFIHSKRLSSQFEQGVWFYIIYLRQMRCLLITIERIIGRTRFGVGWGGD